MTAPAILLHLSFVSTLSFSSTLDDHTLYFDEWRFDWDHVLDFDNDYHGDWHDIISNDDHDGYGCTHNLPPIGKKLCVLQSLDGDFVFKFKDSDGRPQYDIASPMVSAAKELSSYYDDVLLHFDDDSLWSSISSIDGANGYEAVQKCQPFTFMELCAVYNPYADTLNVHIKVAHSKAPRHGTPSVARQHRYSAHRDAEDNVYDAAGDLSMDEAVALLMADYDETAAYCQWRGNALGSDAFELNPVVNVHYVPSTQDVSAVHNVLNHPVDHTRTDVVDQSVQHHYHHVVDESVQHHFHDVVHHPVQQDIHHIIHHPMQQDVYHTVNLYKHDVDHSQFVGANGVEPVDTIAVQLGTVDTKEIIA